MYIYSFFALVCSILYSFSAILCKYSLQYNINVRSLSFTNLIIFLSKNRLWLLGVLLSGIANIAMIQIQSKLDVSIVYSLLNFSYILVLIMGHYFLKEYLNLDQWLGVLTVIIGTIMILSIEDAVTGQPTDIGNLIVLTACSIVICSILVLIAYKNTRIDYELLYAICTGICFGSVEAYLKATTNLVAAEIGYFSIFSLDSIIQFVTLWPFFVMFMFGALGWVFLQITYSHGNISITVPVMAVTQRMVSLSSGYFVFGEYFTLLRVFGLMTIILGVFILIISTLRLGEPKTV